MMTEVLPVYSLMQCASGGGPSDGLAAPLLVIWLKCLR